MVLHSVWKDYKVKRVLMTLRKWFPLGLNCNIYSDISRACICIEMGAWVWLLCLSDITNCYIIKRKGMGDKMSHFNRNPWGESLCQQTFVQESVKQCGLFGRDLCSLAARCSTISANMMHLKVYTYVFTLRTSNKQTFVCVWVCFYLARVGIASSLHPGPAWP